MEKFNNAVKSVLRNQQELFAKENKPLLKMEGGNKPFRHSIDGFFAERDTWLVLSGIKMSKH